MDVITLAHQPITNIDGLNVTLSLQLHTKGLLQKHVQVGSDNRIYPWEFYPIMS